MNANPLYQQERESRTVIAYFLWLFLGIFGVHRFFLGHICTGLLWLFTAGLFGVGWLIDLCLIPDLVDQSMMMDNRWAMAVQTAPVVMYSSGVPAGVTTYYQQQGSGGAYVVPPHYSAPAPSQQYAPQYSYGTAAPIPQAIPHATPVVQGYAQAIPSASYVSHSGEAPMAAPVYQSGNTAYAPPAYNPAAVTKNI